MKLLTPLFFSIAQQRKRLLQAALVLVVAATQAIAADSEQLLILGHDGEAWFPYIASLDSASGSDSSIKWRKIESLPDIAQATLQPGSQKLLVKTNSGALQTLDLAAAENMAEPIGIEPTASFTHLRGYKGGFFAVKLLGGKSRDTEILSIQSGKPERAMFNQAAAQFHPYKINLSLYYSHVSCRERCSPVIQDVWRLNLTTGRARQLTMLNATSYLHSTDPSNRYGYISSNHHGYYHIARLDLSSGSVKWLTSGQVTDSYPSVSSDGSVLFLRRTARGTELMRLVPNGIDGDDETWIERSVSLPKNIQRIRYLELSR